MVDLLDQLHRDVVRDLEARDGVEPRLSLGLLRWFSPYVEEYVARVSAWQHFLALNWAPNEALLPFSLLRQIHASRAGRTCELLGDNPYSIRACHQCAMLHWKYSYDAPCDYSGMKGRLKRSGQAGHFVHNGLLPDYLKWVMGEAPCWASISAFPGSGTTADRRDLADRWSFIDRPRSVPPIVYRSSYADVIERPATPVKYGVCRAASVAKNRKSRRYVASEPNAYMGAQLGLMEVMDERLRKFGRHVSLRDAGVHRSLMRRPGMATIDLSDASDMISRRLCRRVLSREWFDMLSACRSTFVRFPDNDLIPLRTFAPMGNGFCFRILTLIVASCVAVSVDHPTWSVYGDDVIVDRRDFDHVCVSLRELGLVVNTTKSCCGRYTESCGLELLDGVEITPWRPKSVVTRGNRLWDPTAALHAGELGLDNVAHALMSSVERRLVVNRPMQRWEVKVLLQSSTQTDPADVDDLAGLYRWFMERSNEHFTRTVYNDNYKSFRTRKVPSYEELLWQRLVDL
jgi:hypothetical protein